MTYQFFRTKGFICRNLNQICILIPVKKKEGTPKKKDIDGGSNNI